MYLIYMWENKYGRQIKNVSYDTSQVWALCIDTQVCAISNGFFINEKKNPNISTKQGILKWS